MNNNQLLDELSNLTDQVMSKLTSISYEELEGFANQRQLIVEQMDAPLQECEKLKVQALLAFDSEILSRMKYLKDEASQWLARQGVIKSQQSAYQNSYVAESYFIDNKK